MRAIGFRAEKDRLTWSVVEGSLSAPILISNDCLKAPKSYDIAEGLAWYRERVQTTIEEHEVKIAAIRFSETFIKKINSKTLGSMLSRARMEGVVVEAATSKGIKILTGNLNKISSRMNTKSAKAYVGTDELRGIDLSSVPKYRHEAVLTAVSALSE